MRVCVCVCVRVCVCVYQISLSYQVPGQDAVPMWRAFGNQGDVWSMARIPVPEKEANKGYQVYIIVSLVY